MKNIGFNKKRSSKPCLMPGNRLYSQEKRRGDLLPNLISYFNHYIRVNPSAKYIYT